MKNNWNHVNMCYYWQATTAGLSTRFMYCSSYHFKKLNYDSEMFNVSNIF